MLRSVGIFSQRAGSVGGTPAFWGGYAKMGGSLAWRTGASSRSLRAEALGRHCCRRGKRVPRDLFPSFFPLWGNSNRWTFFLYGSASHVAVRQQADPLLLRKALCAPRIHPVSSLYISFSSRWDEFGQNRRGSESPAAPRRGPRVSFTENLKQQSGSFRELKQRVFRRRLGRYTARALLAILFLLLSAITLILRLQERVYGELSETSR